MPPSFRFQPVDGRDGLAALWNAACGEDLAISARFVTYNLHAGAGVCQAAMLGLLDAEPAGFVVASVLLDDPVVMPPDHGWIDALAVTPEHRSQAVGSRLLTWAEGWLLGQGCRTIHLGGGLRPFVPGVPVELHTDGFFTQYGYGGDGSQQPPTVCDLGADLALYTPPPALREIAGQVRPAAPGDRDALLAFLRREFPGRWRYEFEQFLAEGGRLSDYMALWTDRGIDGCCILTFADSARPLERFYPYRLPRPWGQLGSIGVSADCRGRGYGSALLDAGLRRLHNTGVNGCIIDWTDLPDFYGKFGFTPYRRYLQLTKRL